MQFGRERTKTKMEISERSSTLRHDPSYGTISQAREKEETTQHILWALQTTKGKEENNNKQVSQPVKGITYKEHIERSPAIKSIKEVKAVQNGVMGEMKRKARTQKHQAKDTVEELLFDCVYSNKYLEVKCDRK